MPKTKTVAKSKSKAQVSKKPSKPAIVKQRPKKTGLKKLLTSRIKRKVLAIPEGYHSVTPYLIINGAAKAIEFYKKAFGAKVSLRMEQPKGRIGHAELKIGDSKIMLADEWPELQARGPKAYGGSPISIHLFVKNVDKVVERAIANGAKLVRPIENMFYGDRSGGIEDPFGHHWYVATHIEDVSTRELKKRAAAMFAKK
jgi:PhnB protein